MHEDMALVTSAMDTDKAAELEADTSGKKSNLHSLSHELLRTVTEVLSLKHFTTFATAEALNKSFVKTCQDEGLAALVLETILNPWKDASVSYRGQVKKAKEEADKKDAPSGSHSGDKDAEEEVLADNRPTRTTAIESEAKSEVRTCCPSYVLTGNAAMDQQALLKTFKSMTKALDANTANWNHETQGNRRASWYDEAGKKDCRWAYVSGRSAFRSKLGFNSDDFEETLMHTHDRVSPLESSMVWRSVWLGPPQGHYLVEVGSLHVCMCLCVCM